MGGHRGDPGRNGLRWLESRADEREERGKKAAARSGKGTPLEDLLHRREGTRREKGEGSQRKEKSSGKSLRVRKGKTSKEEGKTLGGYPWRPIGPWGKKEGRSC